MFVLVHTHTIIAYMGELLTTYTIEKQNNASHEIFFRIGAATAQAGTFYTKNYVISVPEHSTVKSSFTLRENYFRTVRMDIVIQDQ